MSELRDFVGYNNSQMVEEAIAIFETESGEELYAGDERRMMINSFAYLVEILMAEINYRANNNIIATCDEDTLYQKANERCVSRIEAEKATVNIQFSASEAVSGIVTIPKGTRVTSDGVRFFETSEDAEILIGQTSVLVFCTAVAAGSDYNDIAEGEINVLADTIPYITSVTNPEASIGGSDLEELEAFRQRVIEAPKTYSTAGTDTAYIQKVKEVDSSIVDVVPIYDEENTTLFLYVLCKDGMIPDEALLQEIEEHIYEPNIKASTDYIKVVAATKREYNISVSYKIDTEDAGKANEIQAGVEEAVQEFVKETYSKLGKSINPERLKRYMYNAGAASATVMSPDMVTTEEFEVAICTGVTITYDGLL